MIQFPATLPEFLGELSRPSALGSTLLGGLSWLLAAALIALICASLQRDIANKAKFALSFLCALLLAIGARLLAVALGYAPNDADGYYQSVLAAFGCATVIFWLTKKFGGFDLDKLLAVFAAGGNDKAATT